MTNARFGVWDMRGNKVGRYRGVEIGDQKCRFCGIARETELHMIVKCMYQAVAQHRERMWREISGRCGEEKVAGMKSMRETALMSDLLGGNEVERLKESTTAGEGGGEPIVSGTGAGEQAGSQGGCSTVLGVHRTGSQT